jgi:hypothetical protein
MITQNKKEVRLIAWHGLALNIFPTLVLVLAGCGGGGGGSGFSVALQPLAINDTNAMQVAAAVLDASAFVVDVGESGSSITGVVVEGDSTKLDLSKVVSAHVDLLSVLHAQTVAAQITGVVIPATQEPCLVSGSVTISGEIANPDLTSLSPGDTLTAVFKNCNDGDGLVLNGTMALVVVSSTGTIDLDPNSNNLFIPPYDFTFDVTLTTFSIRETVSGSTATVNGAMTLRENSIDGVVINSEVSGTSLKVTTPATTDTLTDYHILSTVDQGNLNTYSTDSNGTLSSTQLGGIVDFQTTIPYMGVGTDFPDTGQMDITGAAVAGGIGPSNVTVVAVNSQCVRLLVDPNGNGVTSDIVTTWESLASGIPVNCPI